MCVPGSSVCQVFSTNAIVNRVMNHFQRGLHTTTYRLFHDPIPWYPPQNEPRSPCEDNNGAYL